MGAVALHHELTELRDGGPVLLLNSLGSTTAMWAPQVRDLAEEFQLITCDTRGHGESPVPPPPYDIDDLVDDVVALLDNLGLERAYVAGLSLGGMMALRLAVRHPERVDRLALLCTSAYTGDPTPWLERAATVRANGTGAVADMVVARWLTPEHTAADPATVEDLKAMIASTPPDGYAACCEAIAKVDQRADLGAVTAPTLVISADDDPSLPPPQQQVIADGIAGSRLVQIPNCMHLATIDQPEAVTSALREHFATEPHDG